MKPTIFAITILTFLAGLSTMSGPLIVGGKDFQTINPMIKTFAQMQGAMEIAALLAVILGLATSILLMIMQKIENPVLNVMAHVIAYIMFVIYMLPIIYVFMFSFTDARAIKTGKISIHSFTLKNYKHLFELSTAYMPYIVSLVYAIGASLIVTVIAVVVARIVTKSKHKLDQLFEYSVLIPWLLPSTLIAYIIVKLPFSYRMIRASFFSIDGKMEEAAKAMGAKSFYTMRKVILPVIMLVVLSIVVLNLNSLLSEYDLSVFLYHPLFKPLGIVIKGATEETATTEAQAMAFVDSVLLMVISTISLWLGRYGGFGSAKRFLTGGGRRTSWRS